MFLLTRIIQRPLFLAALCIAALGGCGHHDAQAGSNDAPIQIVAAKGVLQQCLGTAWGAARMNHGPGTQGSCNQLPGADLYNKAGSLYQSGDHAGAAQAVTKSAQAGNALAQLRLAIMYDHGDGVPHSAKDAFNWYAQAAAQGEPGAQEQMGAFYEEGAVVPENWDLAYKFYYTSAMQGWKLGQFSLGRAYEFGIGIAQSRAAAIEWFEKSAAQGGAPRAQQMASWLATATNNIGFRDDAERSVVLGSHLRFALLGGDPAGVTFHSSQQRTQWLQQQSQGLNKTESEVFKGMHRADHDACVAAGRDNC